MIDNVKIGAMTYTVVERREDAMIAGNKDGKAIYLNGHITFHDLLIKVKDDCAPDMKRAVVLHEVVHGILENAGQNAPEEVVEALGYGLLALIRDNPDLVLWLRGPDDQTDRLAKELARSNGQRP